MRKTHRVRGKSDNGRIHVEVTLELEKTEKTLLDSIARRLHQGLAGRPSYSKAAETLVRMGIECVRAGHREEYQKGTAKEAKAQGLSVVDARRATSRIPKIRTFVTGSDGKISSYVDKDEDFD